MTPAELIQQITEIAEGVYTALGSGHRESPYQRAMEVGLRLRGIKFEAQKVLEIKYLDHFVGECKPDLLVADCIAIEIKVASQPDATPQDHHQLMKYLRLTGIGGGMLINFSNIGTSKKAEPPPDKPEITVVSQQIAPADRG